jgi:hypothetical protein
MKAFLCNCNYTILKSYLEKRKVSNRLDEKSSKYIILIRDREAAK